MLFFIGIAIIGSIVLAISAFSGVDDHAHDLGHGDHDVPGIFSLKTISLFLIGTGAAGSVAT